MTLEWRMPNHVYNRLIVEGDAHRLAGLIDALRSENSDPDTVEPYPIDFERHVPMPGELRALVRGEGPSQNDVRLAIDWRREHWGTKWNAQVPKMQGAPSDGLIVYSFTTAWRPPDAWLAAVSRAHPQIAFHHEFVEELAHFAGRGDWLGGVIVAHAQLDPLKVAWIDWGED